MALTLTTNFNGSESGTIMTDVFAKSVMFTPSNAMQLYNVSNKISVPQMTAGAFVTKPYDCDFVDGDITVTDRTLNPEKFMITASFCKSQMQDMWMSFVRTNGTTANGVQVLDANNVDLFTNYVVTLLAEQATSEIDRILWQSTVGNIVPALAQISGLREKMLADATVIDVPGAVPITSATVRAAFENTLALVPSAVSAQNDFAFYVNKRTLNAYLTSLSGQGFYGNQINSTANANYLGYRIIVSEGVADNTIVATNTQNLWVATNIDAVTLDVFDLSVVGKDQIGIRGQYVMDTNFGYGKNIVLYTV